MPTYDVATGRHAQVPEDHDVAERLALLQRKGLIEDRPVPLFDDLAQAAALEAADRVGNPHGFYGFVNLMKDGYQYFAGMWAPSGPGGGESQATAVAIPPTDRFMERTSGWCVHTADRLKALPLKNVMDYPRWLNRAIHTLGARTYLGAPLIHRPTGIVLGTFALVGQETTDWSRQDVDMIKRYASQALDYIEALPDVTPPPPLH